jgi:hypothetical protein
MSADNAKLNMPSKRLIVPIVVALVVLGVVFAFYMAGLPQGASSSGTNSNFPPYTDLPAGCVKPAGGFLIIVNQNGFNDSVQHGAPSKSWPVIQVQKGATVNLVVCNSDVQAHGFQITHYFNSNIQTVAPGQVIRVSFVASQSGIFMIYCSIFCSVHIFMQNGELVVT